MFVFLHSIRVEDSLHFHSLGYIFNSLDVDQLGNYNHILQAIDENLRIHFFMAYISGVGRVSVRHS